MRGNLLHFTQLLLSTELFGVDTQSSAVLGWRNAQNENPFFDIGKVEESFALSLRCYARFAQRTLQSSPPWHVEAGAVNVKGLQLHAGTKCLKPDIVWSGKLPSADTVLETLEPFFERMWKSFGLLGRPQNARENLRDFMRDTGTQEF